LAAIPVASVLGLTAAAYAAVQHFATGETLSASKLNANLDSLQSRLDALEASAGIHHAVYCGATAAGSAALDATNGYAAAKTKCQAVSGCGAASHMCTAEEMVSYRSEGGAATPDGWIATGGSAIYSLTSGSSDCGAFTGANGAIYGTTWSGTYPQGRTCDAVIFPVLCCK
jgi:hypothetical protein